MIKKNLIIISAFFVFLSAFNISVGQINIINEYCYLSENNEPLKKRFIETKVRKRTGYCKQIPVNKNDTAKVKQFICSLLQPDSIGNFVEERYDTYGLNRKIIFSDNGIKEETYYKSKDVINYKLIYNYDLSAKLIEKTMFSNEKTNVASVGKWDILYDAEGKIIKEVWHPNNEQDKKNKNHKSILLGYDPNGKLESKSFFSTTLDAYQNITYAYNSAGQMIEYTFKRDNMIILVKITYDKNNLPESELYRVNNTLQYLIEYSYQFD